jgi:H+/Cl- antiporter ClcA
MNELFYSGFVLFVGIILSIFSPLFIYWKIRTRNVDKLTDRKMLLYYYIIIGITIMIIGSLLVLIFGNKINL